MDEQSLKIKQRDIKSVVSFLKDKCKILSENMHNNHHNIDLHISINEFFYKNVSVNDKDINNGDIVHKHHRKEYGHQYNFYRVTHIDYQYNTTCDKWTLKEF